MGAWAFWQRFAPSVGPATEASDRVRSVLGDGPPHCYRPALDEAERLLNELGVEPPQLATGE